MFDERAYIARVEAAEPDEFARLVAHPSREEEAALRLHFGDQRFERLHEIAARSTVRARGERRGNVVVIHGIMGGELTAFDRKGDGDRIWAHVLRLVTGAMGRLRLDESGDAEHDESIDVRATGIMKREYGEQLLRLSEEWTVRAFWYDWRKDLRKAAELLAAQIHNWFGPDQPVHLVAHSMGGLVARAFIAQFPDRWARMWDEPGDGRAGGRLLMLGTPNHGSFAVPQIITGLEGMVRKLAKVDLRHDMPKLLRIVNSFPGSYQMLPSPFVMPEVEPLYRAETYGADLAVPQRHLDGGRAFHEMLRDVVDPARMVYVAGYNQRTYNGIRNMEVRSADAYQTTLAGDGRVPHALGLLEGVPAYFVDEVHGALPGNARILKATTELLETGATSALPDRMPTLRGVRAALREQEVSDLALLAREEDALEMYVRRAQVRGRGDGSPLLGEDERRAEEVLLRGWVGRGADELPGVLEPAVPAGGSGGGTPDGADDDSAATSSGAGGRAAGPDARRLEVRLVLGGIEDVDARVDRPVDVIAVGHYIGVRPQHAELAIDRAITRAVLRVGEDVELDEEHLLLTQYTDRGTLRGELGQPFLLPDPRVAESGTSRLIAVMGMGLPGRFGAPELTVLARELAWMTERLGKSHLAAVLIGAGVGNLRPRDAVVAWMRGLQSALAAGHEPAGAQGLTRVTFVEHDPARIEEIDQALREQARWYEASGGLDVVYEPWTDEEIKALEPEIERRDAERVGRRRERPRKVPPPTRITLSLERREERTVYRFGAITESASVPEREIPLDASLVEEANDELPGMSRVADQLRRGEFLQRLLVPHDLRPSLAGDAPIVMLLDATTARIHWEMLAQPEFLPPGDGGPADAFRYEACFLGTSRGFTRQLRTVYAPPPEAPSPQRRPLRVLIVADPADDDRLPGAMQEGYEVAELFERFNQVHGEEQRVEVVRLFGPRRATRTAVLETLMAEPFDILHFAGHCVYDARDPQASGWIFTGGARLSANELRRIDRAPRFVFSNACESGITPARSELRSAALAPSFAEAFFDRGVANFVCTAWPVDDAAARRFALELYASLLGLGAEGDPFATQVREPAPMHEAMRQARLAVAAMPSGRRSWGAYQHYGNPYDRLFERARRRAAVAHGS